MELPRAPIPPMATVRQTLPREHLADVPSAVRDALKQGGLADRVRSGQSVAVTAGSRGIADIGAVLATVVGELRAMGAEPFIVPAMGSHGGATVEGQRAVLAEYGVTEREVGAPIRATMETVEIGHLDDGTAVHLDRFAHEADAIVVVGRVKAHTAFRGDIESGLCKMTAIGLGKQRGAETIHARGLRVSIPEVARVTLANARIVLGLGLVENAYHLLHTVEAARPERFHDTDRALLTVANGLLPRVPFDELDVLVVDQLGKDVSGSGMDYNVVGMWRRIGGEQRPLYKRIVVLDLTPRSEGNGLGMGIADFTTRRLFDKLDLHKTYMNALTANALEAVKVPIILGSDREAVEVAVKSSNAAAPRVVWIKNTLALEEMLVSEALIDEASGQPTLSVEGEPRPMAFDERGDVSRARERQAAGAASGGGGGR